MRGTGLVLGVFEYIPGMLVGAVDEGGPVVGSGETDWALEGWALDEGRR